MPNQAEIFQRVVNVIACAFNIEAKEIRETSALFGDLGAKSIDFLDIVFRLESEFQIKIPRNQLFPEFIFDGNSKYMCDNKVTLEGINELRAQWPWADLSEFEKDPSLSKIGDLFTVEMICKYIDFRINKS